MTMPTHSARPLPDPEVIEDAVALLKRLGHPMRLAIVCRLIEGEMSVAEMESELRLRQPSLSQQLGELRNGGIIEPRREAKNVVYSLADPKAASIVATLHALFCAGGTPAPVAALPRKGLGRLNGAAVFARVGAVARLAGDDPSEGTPATPG